MRVWVLVVDRSPLFDDDSFLGVFPIMIGPFVGDGVHALFRKWYRKT